MAGKVKNCPHCGKLFADYGAHMCRDCEDKMREKEAEVVNYVRDHPKAKVLEITEATGCSEQLIKKLIREGRFEQVGVKMTYPCEKCGEPIITGKLCQNCQEKIRNDLQATQSKAVAAKQMAKAAAPKPQSKGKGMYSLKNR